MLGWIQNLFSSKKKPPLVVVPDNTPPALNDRLEPDVQATVLAPFDTTTDSGAPKTAAVSEAAGPSWMQRSELNTAYANWLFDNRKEGELFTSSAENEILAAIQQILKSEQSGSTLVRRMPGVVPQLLQSLRTENFSGAQLARTISQDVVLVGEVIRLANSSYYNPAQPINSIENGILVLGHQGLRQLVTGVAFKPIIDMKSGQYSKRMAQRIWDQSEKCATACRLLAGGEGADPFEAFLAGLIQNVGMIASLRVMDQMADGDQDVGSLGFYNSLMRHARTLSVSISREWNFPEAVTRAIEEQGASGKNLTLSPLGKVLFLADYLSKMRMLIDEGKLKLLPAVTKGLSEKQVACLDKLAEKAPG